MRLTVKLSIAASTTVRLTPSTVIEPFSTRYRVMLCGSENRSTSQRGRPSASRSPGARPNRVPVASTWPWTRWPPSRSPSAIARSRLTREPAASAPRLERCSVSAITSALNSPVPAASCSGLSTTVRQTPLTAMESPCRAPEQTSGPRRRIREESPISSMETTSPSSSMMPVNTRVLLALGARTPGVARERTRTDRKRDAEATARTGTDGGKKRRTPKKESSPTDRPARGPRGTTALLNRPRTPPIRTLTVGPGISPGQPAAGCGRVADCNRRFGFSPTPECAERHCLLPSSCHDPPWLREGVLLCPGSLARPLHPGNSGPRGFRGRPAG